MSKDVFSVNGFNVRLMEGQLNAAYRLKNKGRKDFNLYYEGIVDTLKCLGLSIEEKHGELHIVAAE
ncbi:hypothetical protein P0G10_06700 [Eubacteriales bacterium DFI.9.88]|nr:hypothetical protein [Eubacteriales bacterium DFI.9.88]